ncbi:MAG: succinyl-diaminopimelate desuccinylase [Gammaproteobacteria bacterium]
MNAEAVLALASQLIQQPSITPEDADCQTIIQNFLNPLGFQCTPLPFGKVKNLWATHGQGEPCLFFAGHTDVVPPGPEQSWNTPPFVPTVKDGILYGRGAADMKGAVAAFLMACQQFLHQYPQHQGTLGILLTSDEEGDAIDGTQKVIEHLVAQRTPLTWCLVGEASSQQRVGDGIKIGRRGSLNGQLTLQGKQGHIAYPHLANNAIHQALPAFLTLAEMTWDEGNAEFPPTSFQFSNLQAGTGATNVIPGQLQASFNFRFSPLSPAQSLMEQTEAILQHYGLSYQLNWQLSAQPFMTPQGALLSAAQQAIQETTGLTPQLTTDGGTSDGRFIAPTGCEVIELGVCNGTIHQANECVGVQDLMQLTAIYKKILMALLGGY